MELKWADILKEYNNRHLHKFGFNEYISVLFLVIIRIINDYKESKNTIILLLCRQVTYKIAEIA